MAIGSFFRGRRESSYFASAEDTQNATNPASDASQQPRLRGIIGYHNAFDDGAIDYDLDHLQLLESRGLTDRSPTDVPHTSQADHLPDYSCPIVKAGAIGVKLERVTPFDFIQNPTWFESFLVLRGTMLNVHHLKQTGKDRSADAPGKLIKSYTLQHAEAGIAADHKKIEMIPRNPLHAMLAPHKLQALQESDPQLFEARHVYVVRLRLETDQLILRFRSSEARTSWLTSICSAIDLAPAIDERTEPRYQTLPRRARRRRDRQPPAANAEGVENAAFNVAGFVEEQERIMREQFPHLMEAGNRMTVMTPGDVETEHPFNPDTTTPMPMDADRADIDNDLVRAASNTEFANNRLTRLSTYFSSVHHLFDANTSNPSSAITPGTTQAFFDPLVDPSTLPLDVQPDISPVTGKWAPVTVIDPVREARCARRCMPTLLCNSKRSSRLIMSNGKRMWIDWDAQKLTKYTSDPPKYSQQPPAQPLTQEQSHSQTYSSSADNPPSAARSLPRRIDTSRSVSQAHDVDNVSSSPGSELFRQPTYDENRMSNRFSMLLTPQRSAAELPRPPSAVAYARVPSHNQHADLHHSMINNDDTASGSSGNEDFHVRGKMAERKDSWTDKFKKLTRKQSRPKLTRHKSTVNLSTEAKRTMEEEDDSVPELPSMVAAGPHGTIGSRRGRSLSGSARPYSTVM